MLSACAVEPSPPPSPEPPPPPPPAVVDPQPSPASSSGGYGYSGDRPANAGLDAVTKPHRTVVRRRIVRPSMPIPAALSDLTGSTGTTMRTAQPLRGHAAAPAMSLCPITKTRLPAGICDELTEQDQLTQDGVDAAPTSINMMLKQSLTYTYSIGAKGNEAVVRRNVTTASAAVATGQIALGHYNFARLSGDPGIKIEPLDEEVQDTVANPTPIWRWKLTALEPGAHALSLEAGVELRAENMKPVRLGQNAKRIDVAVDVTSVDKIAQFANTTNTVLGISTDLLKKLALFFGAVSAALIAFRAIRGKSKAGAPS
jgi:hypothetical protein